MTHYVDGRARAAATVAFPAAGGGQDLDRCPAEPRVAFQGPHPARARSRRRCWRAAALLMPDDAARRTRARAAAVMALTRSRQRSGHHARGRSRRRRDPAVARGRAGREGGRRRRARRGRTRLQRPVAHAAALPAVRGHGRPGTAVIVCPGGGYARLAMANEAAGAVRALAAARRERVRPQVPARGVRPPGAAAGRPARHSRWCERVRASSACGPIASGCSAPPPAVTWPRRRPRCSTPRKADSGAAIDAISAQARFRGAALSRDHHARSVRACRLTPQPAGRRRRPRRSLDRMSSRRACAADMPPVFLVHTAEDTQRAASRTASGSSRPCAVRGVPVEAHFYERGAHGFGMAGGLGTTSGWVARWTDWMRAHGWL